MSSLRPSDHDSVKSATIAAEIEDARRWSEAVLERSLPTPPAVPARLAEAIRYAALAGGKRLRPALCRWFANGLGGTDADAEFPAVALELLHTYSLVHDDLPCMDDDALRRGKPTVHVAFDEATAVLVGDAMQTMAFGLLARHPEAAALVDVLARASGPEGMVGGQALDLAFADLREPTNEDVRAVHLLKTSALFGAASEMGAIVAGASASQREAAARYGLALGLCFQATDDLLDVTGSAGDLGKTPGKDEHLQRPSLVRVLGLQKAQEQAVRLADEARRAAAESGLPDSSPALQLVDFVLNRTS